MSDAGSPQAWFQGLPFVTKYLFGASFAMTVMANMGLLNMEYLYYAWKPIWTKFQIWRLVTPGLFLGKFSMSFLFKAYLLVMYSQRYEMAPFRTGGSESADYLFMLVIAFGVLNVISTLLELYFYNDSLVMVVTYLWSRKNASSVISIYGVPVQGIYLPWAIVVLTILMGGSPVPDLIGIAVGHVYYFLADVLPNTQGITALKTPQTIQSFVDSRTTTQTFGQTGAPVRAPRPQGHQWGRGNVLGAGR